MKKSVKALTIYQKAVPAVHQTTKLFNFLNKEPTAVELCKHRGEIEDLEASLTAYLAEVRTLRERVNEAYLDDPLKEPV